MIHYADEVMSQRAIRSISSIPSNPSNPSKARALLAFEVACERLRNTLDSPDAGGKPSASSAERQQAYRLILEALANVRDAYGIDAGPMGPAAHDPHTPESSHGNQHRGV
jgi:hypothetical protein